MIYNSENNPILKSMFIGIGNEYRNDDGVGIYIVRKLTKLNRDVNTVELSGEGTELMEIWKNAKEVYIFDAVRSREKPGTIFEFDANQAKIPSNFFNYSTHNFSLAEAVELSRTLDQLPPTFKIFGIEGSNFSEGSQLSPEVKATADKFLQNIFINSSLRDKFKIKDDTFNCL